MRAGGGEGFVPRGGAAACLGRRGNPRRINRARLAAVERRLPARLLQRAEGGYRGIILRHAYILSAVVGCGRTYVTEGVRGVSGEVIAAGLADIGGAAATGLGSEIKAAARGIPSAYSEASGKARDHTGHASLHVRRAIFRTPARGRSLAARGHG